MDLSISIVSWNTRGMLDDCLRSVYASTSDLRFEVIVVDNASTDGSPEMVRASYPQVKLIQNDCNAGFARANNQALRIARGRYFLLLNSDTLVSEGAFARMVAWMDAHPEVGACGPLLTNADGSLQPSWAAIPTLATELRGVHDRRVNGIDPSLMSVPQIEKLGPFEVGWVGGACLMARRSAIDTVGPMDEGYFMYCEETDWCWRIRRAGYSVALFPGSTITHLGGASSRRAPLRTLVRMERSRLRFLWRSSAAARVLYLPLCVLAAARIALRGGLALLPSNRPAPGSGTRMEEQTDAY